MVACTHDEFPRPPHDEHPVIALLAVAAILAAILLITWARFEVHGVGDIESALTEEGPAPSGADQQSTIDEAVTSNRFAGGVSPQ